VSTSRLKTHLFHLTNTLDCSDITCAASASEPYGRLEMHITLLLLLLLLLLLPFTAIIQDNLH